MTSKRVPSGQVSKLCLINPKDSGKFVDILGRGLGLPIEDGGYGYFIAANGFAEIGKGEILLDLGIEEGLGLNGEAWC